jgi:hypothetical protein
MKALLAIVLVSSVASATPVGGDDDIGVGPGPVALTAAQRKTRATLIRDTAAAKGMTNAALLAGIGEVETNFAHCWSEATWACQGPNSSSCGGGPVIAGASDGPCSAQQGGLGMFQFDSGTYAQTLATYGANIVTIQGNTDAVIPFLVTRAKQSVTGIHTDAEALAWMNSIKIADGDAEYEKWLYFIAWRYNGCMGCTAQQNKYRAGTNKLRDEFGPGFWTISSTPPPPPASGCDPVPADGRVIDETDGCFHKDGTAASWYAAESGMNGACLYTYTTDDPAADNHATWQIDVAADGRYSIEVYTDAAIAKTHQAKYAVEHAGGTTEVVIDQSAVTGFRTLGELDLVAGMPASVSLGDNTGEAYDANAKVPIMFDAVRVLPVQAPPADDEDATASDGGCAAGGGGASGWLLIAAAALFARRSCRTPAGARAASLQ